MVILSSTSQHSISITPGEDPRLERRFTSKISTPGSSIPCWTICSTLARKSASPSSLASKDRLAMKIVTWGSKGSLVGADRAGERESMASNQLVILAISRKTFSFTFLVSCEIRVLISVWLLFTLVRMVCLVFAIFFNPARQSSPRHRLLRPHWLPCLVCVQFWNLTRNYWSVDG